MLTNTRGLLRPVTYHPTARSVSAAFASDRRTNGTYFAVVKGAQQRHCKKCAREHRLMRTYGLARGQYDAMYEDQSGHCAGCEVEFNDRRVIELVAAYDSKGAQLAVQPDANVEMRTPITSYGQIKDATAQTHGHRYDYDAGKYKKAKIAHWEFHHPNGQQERL